MCSSSSTRLGVRMFIYRRLALAFVSLLLMSGFAFAAPVAPSGLTVFVDRTSANKANTTQDTYVFFWNDNSTDETSFIITYNGGNAFTTVTSTTTSTTGNIGYSFLINTLPVGTVIQWQVAASNASGASAASAVTAASTTTEQTAQMVTPTSVAATVTNETAITVTWTDASTSADGDELWMSTNGGAYSYVGDILFYQTKSYGFTGLTPGTPYQFELRAYQEPAVAGNARTYSAYSTPSTSVKTKDGFTSLTYQPITYNQAFSYQAVVSTGSTRNSWNITGLPTGLTFNSSTGVVSGTPTVSGLFLCPMTATFASGWTTNNTLQLRIIRPPAAPVTATTISSQTVANGGNTSVTLTDKFSDPDSESAVQIITNVGTMNFILYNAETPATVTNFLSYVNNASSTGNYNGAVFHRSVPGFVVQGGGFKVQSAPNNFTSITTTASPNNEPGISNLTGTVAMAKLGSSPNSATDQFFVNLVDNSSNLDNQNGGFTVFGRMAGNGMSVANAMAALPTVDSPVNGVNVNGVNNTSLTSWPLLQNDNNGEMDTTQVVSITSAAPVAVLSYSVTGNTNPTAVTATINGTSVKLTGSAGGQSNVTVSATDLDGNTVSQTFAVSVNQAPAITSTAPSAVGTVGTAYNFSYTASGYPAPTFSVTSGALPGGLTLSSAGAITGSCTTAGTFTGVVTATNSSGTNTQSFSITVNQVPAFTNGPPTTTAVLGTAYSFTCTASGSPTPTFAVTAGGLPTGLSLSSSGAITGTPTATGTFTGTITAANTAGTATQNFSISVNQVPAFTNGPPTTTAVLGTAYSFTYTASGTPAPTFTVSSGALPTGLTLSSAGAITGTPTAIGTFSGTVKATNTVGNVTQNFSITVNQLPAITNGPPTSTGLVGTAYSFTYTATGSPTPTFAVTAGSLPTGLSLSTAGAITGTPSVAGAYTGTVTASNAAGTTTQNFSISVNQVPAFTNGPPTTTAVLGTAYSFTYTASGTPAPTFTVSSGALPTGLSLSSAGAITGTPTAIGTFTGTVKATNTAGNVTQNFSITVNQLPAITNGPPTSTGLVGTAYSFTYTATGSPTPTFAVTAGSLPTGLSLSTAGAITGTPSVAGAYTGTVTASNAGGTTTQNFSITINQLPAITNGPPTSTGLVGTAYSFTYTATGSPTPTFAVTAGSLPTGLSLSTAGAITGTPSVAGAYTGTVTASNAGGTTTQNFSITINQVPAFTNGPPTTTAILSTAYSFTCTASGYPAPTFTVSAGALPTGLTLSSAGAITGTPTAIGTFTGTVKATNTVGNTTQNFSITVNQLPAITNGPPTSTGVVGTAYSFTYTATGSPTPTFAVTAGSLPTGLSLSSAGAITGTPTATGVFTGTVTASNTAGTTTQNFSITVNQVPAFTNGPPTTTAVLGTAYSFTCTASGYPAPTFTVSAGALPTGLTLSSAGAITGSPTATGTFTGTVKASNSVGNVTQNFSITVNQLPAFTNGPPPTTGTIGTAYSFTYTASGSPAPTFTVTAGGLPTGLSLSTAGAITGTPTTAGTFSGTVTASNTAGTTTQDFSISVPKLSATVTLGSLAQTYDGTAKVATATTNPTGKTVTFTYNGLSTPPINAGSYTVVGTIVDTNYAGTSLSGTLVISQASATITLSNTTQTYDGTAKAVTATTSPTGLSVGITYNGSSTAPSGFGTYTVAASITDPNYTGTQNGSLTIQGQTSSSWKAQHFTAGQISAGLSADNADPDGDTLQNLAEYALGTDPLVRNTPPQPTYDVNGLTLTFTRPKALPNVTYTAQSTDSLGTWNAVTLVVITDGPVQTIQARDPLTSGNTSRRFMQLIFGTQ